MMTGCDMKLTFRNMVKLFDDFFAFMRYCLGYKRNISNVEAGMDRQKLYSFASK